MLSQVYSYQVKGYFKIFRTLAEIVKGRLNVPPSDADELAKNAVTIRQLPYEWNNYPYIFYQFKNQDGKISTIGLRGDQLCEGIADGYEFVDEVSAHTIASTVLAGAPLPVEVEVTPDQFQRGYEDEDGRRLMSEAVMPPTVN